MLTTIEGMYENRRIELAERPAGIERAKVYVTFVGPMPAATAIAAAEELDQWLAALREGLPLGGPPYPDREELYGRGR